MIFKSIPSNNLQEAQLVFTILDDFSDEEIRAIIEPCIGSYTEKIVIEEK